MNADAGSFQGQEHPSPARARVSLWSSWFALLAAPHAWSLQLLVNSALTGYACYPHDAPLDAPMWDGVRPILYLVEAAAVALCLAGGWIAWRNWRRTRDEKPGSGKRLVERGDGRTRFMAMAAMMISALFLVAIVFSSVHLFVLPGCGR
jgi:hypothetical protein